MYFARHGLHSLSTIITSRDLSEDGRLARLVVDFRGRRCVGLGVVVVYQFFEFFAGLEIRHSFSGNADRISRLGIATAPCTTFTHAKTSKATQLDLLALIQSLNDAFEDNLD